MCGVAEGADRSTASEIFRDLAAEFHVRRRRHRRRRRRDELRPGRLLYGLSPRRRRHGDRATTTARRIAT